MREMAQHISSNLRELEIHATIFSEFITLLDNLKSGWDAHLGFLKTAYADHFKYL